MRKIDKLIIVLFILLNFGSYSFAENNFFEKGKNKYDEKKYEESKFLFQRSIVFNPKDQNSYLYFFVLLFCSLQNYKFLLNINMSFDL